MKNATDASHKWAEVLGLKCAPGEFIFTALSPFRLIITIHFDGSLLYLHTF